MFVQSLRGLRWRRAYQAAIRREFAAIPGFVPDNAAERAIWIVLSLLTVPMFILAPKELAPPEDQSIVFGIVEAPADATIDQTTFYSEAANKEFMSIPEQKQTFHFSYKVTDVKGNYYTVTYSPDAANGLTSLGNQFWFAGSAGIPSAPQANAHFGSAIY